MVVWIDYLFVIQYYKYKHLFPSMLFFLLFSYFELTLLYGVLADSNNLKSQKFLSIPRIENRFDFFSFKIEYIISLIFPKVQDFSFLCVKNYSVCEKLCNCRLEEPLRNPSAKILTNPFTFFIKQTEASVWFEQKVLSDLNRRFCLVWTEGSVRSEQKVLSGASIGLTFLLHSPI